VAVALDVRRFWVEITLIFFSDHHNRLHVKQKYRANAESRNNFKKVLEKGKDPNINDDHS